MTLYLYTARDANGKMIQGTQDAGSEFAAIKILQNKNLLITKIVDAAQASQAAKSKVIKKHRRAKTDDLLFFCRQLAILLEAGIPLLRSLEILVSQVQSIQLTTALENLKADIKAGSSFKDAVAKNPKVFPSLWAYLIEAGETSGNLPLVLTQLANHLETSLNLKKKMISALVYPAILVCVSIGAVLVFLLKIIPVFERLFKSFHAELPALTQGVIDLSQFFQHYFVFVAAGVAAVVYFGKRYIATSDGRRNADRLVLKLPAFGGFIRDGIVARITTNLATLVQSGVNLLESLHITSRAAGNTVFEEALSITANDVQQGKTLAASLDQHNLFSPIVINMIAIGEESGKLADMLTRVAKQYDEKVDVFISRLSTIIEPIVMVIVGGVVGVLVVAMFLPIMSLSQTIH